MGAPATDMEQYVEEVEQVTVYSDNGEPKKIDVECIEQAEKGE